MTAVIETRGLTKTYGTVRALDGLDLSIPRGGVYGVLGPNGAGKSTLFRILLGLIRPTDGTANIMNGPVGDIAHMRLTGSMIETPRYPPYMTARQVLRWLALEHGIAGTADIPLWLDRVGLSEAADRKVRGFSVGMMQRLAHDDGLTVILASHQLLEVQRVCDRVAILNKGRLVREGAVSELTAVGERLRLTLSPIGDAMIVLGDKGSVDGDVVLADIKRHEAPDLFRALIEKGVDVTEARWVGTDLEAIFFTETGAVQAPETIHAG